MNSFQILYKKYRKLLCKNTPIIRKSILYKRMCDIEKAIDEFTSDKEEWDSFVANGSRSQSQKRNGFLVPTKRN